MKTKNIIKILLAFSLLVLVSEFALAQEPLLPAVAAPAKRELMLFEEIPIVTSASKHAESLLRAPAAISVITSEDIENMDYEHLWDLFRRVPGVDVQTFDARRGSVAPRGFTEAFTRRNQILIDGRSSYSPLFGGTEWSYLPIFPEDIERIEVIRGPNATLYGSNAFTGVINIITKDPKDTKGVTLKEGIGTHGYQRSYLRYGGELGKLDYRFDYAYHFDYGYGTSGGTDVNDKERDHTVAWNSKYKINDKSSVDVIMGLKLDVGRPVNTSAVSTTTSSNIRSDYQILRYNTKLFGDQDAYLQFFHNETQENKHGAKVQFARNDSKVRQYDFEFQHTVKWLKDKMNTVWGLGFRHDGGQIYLFDTQSSTLTRKYGGKLLIDRIYRLFFNNDYKINNQWTFIFGAMFENNHFTGGSCSPRTSILYAPKENHVFRATYARAYRTPTMLEIKQNNTTGGTAPGVPTTTTAGNNALKNEVVDAYELGYNSALMDNRLKLGAQAYINVYGNLIDVFQAAGAPNYIYSFDNSNSARAKGIELNAEFDPKDWVKLYTNVTFEKIRDTKDFFKNTAPKFKANFGSRFKWDKLGLIANFDTYYVDTYYSKDLENVGDPGLKVNQHIRFDFRIAKTFFKDTIEWAIRGENLFGPEHLEARSGPTTVSTDVDIDRAIYTTVTAKF